MRGNCRNTDACRQRGREIASAHGQMDPQQLCRKQAHEVMSLSIEQELLGEREKSPSRLGGETEERGAWEEERDKTLGLKESCGIAWGSCRFRKLSHWRAYP
jgi:hypothetical protein